MEQKDLNDIECFTTAIRAMADKGNNEYTDSIKRLAIKIADIAYKYSGEKES